MAGYMDVVEPKEAVKVKRVCFAERMVYGVGLDDHIIALAEVVAEAPPARKPRKKKSPSLDGEDISAPRHRGRKARGMADPRESLGLIQSYGKSGDAG